MIKEEKATLKVFLSKKKNKTVNVIFADGKSMPVNGLVDIPYEANEKEVSVKRDDGKVVEITVGEKKYGLKNSPNIQPKANPEKAPKKHFAKAEKREPSRAPYNFIPLNDVVVESEHRSSVPGFGSYKDGLLSGYIDLIIDTKTPVYVRRLSKQSEFFEIGGRSLIPGSTIRGLTKNIMKIVSFAKFQKDEDFEDRNLYYRTVDSSSIGKLYKFALIDENDGCFPRAQAGLLIRSGARYSIKPSRYDEGTQFYRINGRFIGGSFLPDGFERSDSVKIFSSVKVFFVPQRCDLYPHEGLNLRYAMLDRVSRTPLEGSTEGYLIVSGPLGNKKHMQWVINTADPEKPALAIPQHVIEDYEQDKSRNSVNLLKMLEKENEVPCFYLTDEKGNVTDFGHTALFRKRYSWSVGDHVPENLNPEENTNKVNDIVEAIFGKLEHWAGRVYFEDAELQSNGANVFMDKATLKILSTPKPTCFQHYLEQPLGTNTNKHDLCHWDSEASIRGYKMYWHRNTNGQTGEYGWKERDPIPENDTQHAYPIKPAKPGTKFKGRVRFDNLSSVELGALLFSLDLPEGCCHKVGLGKPYGLGSIAIQADLVLVDRPKRYSKLFDRENWFLSEEKSKSSIDNYKKVFERYVLSNIGKKELSSLWDHERMKELKSMFLFSDCSSKEWLEQTRYLQIGNKNNEYSDRKVLPKPSQVSSVKKYTTK